MMIGSKKTSEKSAENRGSLDWIEHHGHHVYHKSEREKMWTLVPRMMTDTQYKAVPVVQMTATMMDLKEVEVEMTTMMIWMADSQRKMVDRDGIQTAKRDIASIVAEETEMQDDLD
jgi:hypothetical protein